jgi:hypothetical protein
MAKEKAARAGAPAWMVTFADLMSLLVCFFELIISFSVQSVRDAFGVSKDWQARAVVEINGRPKTRNIKLPPHQNIVVFMPKPDIPLPDDLEEPSDSNSIPAAAEREGAKRRRNS